MNKKELDLLNKTIEAVVMISDRLDVVFKSVEVIQEHIIKDRPKIIYDTRIDMFKDKHSDDCKCNTCYEEQAARGDFIDESDFVEDDINF